MSKWKGLAFFLFFLSFIWFVGGISVVYYIIAAGDGTIAVIMVTVLMGISLAEALGSQRLLLLSRDLHVLDNRRLRPRSALRRKLEPKGW
jgi:hypothetical protein